MSFRFPVGKGMFENFVCGESRRMGGIAACRQKSPRGLI
jgi:hypothetical protein